MASSIDVLYACTCCHHKFKYEELSYSQQLCKNCRKKFPLVQCIYCNLDFHQMDKKSQENVCEQCSKDFKQYGPPSNCSICNLLSAFKGTKCGRCVASEKKYGSPVQCEHCKLNCAFKKPIESTKKINGKTLCLLCTLNYKKAIYRNKKSHNDKHTPSSKKPRLDQTDDTSPFVVGLPHSRSTNSRVESDPLSSELMQETERLRTELSSLKKQLSQKDQQLLEKDKLICTLRAENLDREKEHRQKILVLQRKHDESQDSLKDELQALKKQAAGSKSRKSHPHSSVPSSLLNTS